MVKLMLECPKTSKPIFTGIRYEDSALKTKTFKMPMFTVYCPHCEQDHISTDCKAFLEQEKGPGV